MILLWTTSSKPGAAIIRWGLSEPTSHFATAFFAGPDKGLVIHHNFTGFHIEWLPYFLKKNRLVYALKPIQQNTVQDLKAMRELMSTFSGTSYDEGSFLYFSYRIALRKLFGKPMPNRGQWGDKREPLCTGHARVHYRLNPHLFSKPISDFDLTSPGQLYRNMVDSGKLIDAKPYLTSSLSI